MQKVWLGLRRKRKLFGRINSLDLLEIRSASGRFFSKEGWLDVKSAGHFGDDYHAQNFRPPLLLLQEPDTGLWKVTQMQKMLFKT